MKLIINLKEAENYKLKIPVPVPVPVPVSESESPQTPPQAKVDSIDRSTPAIVHPQPTQPNKQKRPESAEFTLRPFRTRPTPVPSPNHHLSVAHFQLLLAH